MVLDDIFTDVLSQFLETILNAILYPFNSIFGMFGHWVDIVFTSFTALVNSINELAATVVSFFITIFTMFPQPYGSMIILAFTIIVALRVYFIIRGS
jgi:ABC-type dipeptide/oligopeptide/nickel transport system permease subunit